MFNYIKSSANYKFMLQLLNQKLFRKYFSFNIKIANYTPINPIMLFEESLETLSVKNKAETIPANPDTK